MPRKFRVIVFDSDATDDPIQGNPESRLFHGYNRNCSNLPLHSFCGDIPLWAGFRTLVRKAFSNLSNKSSPRFIVVAVAAGDLERLASGGRTRRVR